MQPLSNNQQRLAEEATRSANEIALRYERIFPQYADDIESAAYYGAVRAAATYEPDLSGVWDRWSGMCIKGEIHDFLDSAYCRHKKKWIDTLDASGLDEREDVRGEASLALMDARLSHSRLMCLLPTKHRILCELMCENNLTAYQASVMLGQSGNHGNKLYQEAISLLRKRLVA